MSDFVVLPLTRDVTTHVRTTRRAPRYGHPAHHEVATGTGPCRECLRTFTVGAEERLLFTHNPFEGLSPLPQPGPVFIHAESCERHEGPGYPEGLRDIPVMVQPYHQDGTVGEPRPLPSGAESETLGALLDSADVRFAFLRHAQAGCYVARVERAGGA